MSFGYSSASGFRAVDSLEKEGGPTGGPHPQHLTTTPRRVETTAAFDTGLIEPGTGRITVLLHTSLIPHTPWGGTLKGAHSRKHDPLGLK
ncbi:unnamed protein product [Boreogadus saida]